MSEAQHQITCREFVELITDYLEGQLAEARRLEIKIHLGDCHGCEIYLAQMRYTITALRGLAQNGDFPRTRERALAAFRELQAR